MGEVRDAAWETARIPGEFRIIPSSVSPTVIKDDVIVPQCLDEG